MLQTNFFPILCDLCRHLAKCTQVLTMFVTVLVISLVVYDVFDGEPVGDQPGALSVGGSSLKAQNSNKER